MSAQDVVSFIDRNDNRAEVTLDVSDYRAASESKLSLAQYYAQKYPVKQVLEGDRVVYPDGTPLEQFAACAGIRVRPDPARGIRATTMAEIMHGVTDLSAGALVRPQGVGADNISGRILFQEIMMQMINAVLMEDKDDYLIPWENAIAVKDNIIGPRADQPLINVTGPEASAAQPIGQLAEPAVMVSITLSQRSYTIPTKSIGLMVADEALKATSIDLVAVMLASQARGERIRRIESDMAGIINGDVDTGSAAVTFANASTYDTVATINAANPITQLAWVKWLREKYQTMSVTDVVTDIDSALAIEARSGKPTVLTDTSSQANRFPADYSIENMGMPLPKLLLVPTAVVGADRVVGFDRRYALRQVTNISASYSAVETFVMRRGQGLRFDYGTAIFKLYPEAFTGLVIGA